MTISKHPDGTTFASYCQHCVWQTHPQMMTTYCLPYHTCDRCKHLADCAMVRLTQTPVMPPSTTTET